MMLTSLFFILMLMQLVPVEANYKVIYQSGTWVHHLTFTSAVAYTAWMAGVMAIKGAIEEINNDGGAGEPRVNKYRRWLASIRTFGFRWGKVIPGDVKAAANDVEMNIGVHVTNWDQGELPAPYDEDTDDETDDDDDDDDNEDGDGGDNNNGGDDGKEKKD